MQLAVKWHVCKAIFAPAVWQLPARRRGRAAEQGGGAQPEGAEQPVAVQPAHNNYLLLHNPHLAELLADMPALLAPEQVQLLADVQVRRLSGSAPSASVIVHRALQHTSTWLPFLHPLFTSNCGHNICVTHPTATLSGIAVPNDNV